MHSLCYSTEYMKALVISSICLLCTCSRARWNLETVIQVVDLPNLLFGIKNLVILHFHLGILFCHKMIWVFWTVKIKTVKTTVDLYKMVLPHEDWKYISFLFQSYLLVNPSCLVFARQKNWKTVRQSAIWISVISPYQLVQKGTEVFYVNGTKIPTYSKHGDCQHQAWCQRPVLPL